MSGRILVVDDVDFNLKLLDAKLKQQYYQVFTAKNGREAIEKAKELKPDVILMDIMMPEMDGFEATSIIKNDPEVYFIPVVIVTALNSTEDKIRGLECGADDFITKPINDHALMSRLRSLIRLKSLTDELRVRNETLSEMGGDHEDIKAQMQYRGANILVVDDDEHQIKKIAEKLATIDITVHSCDNFQRLEELAKTTTYSVIIVSSLLLSDDALQICSNIRADEKLKMTPIMVLIDESDIKTVDTAYELGVNDYITMPIDVSELQARVISQVRRKNYQDALKNTIISSINQSVKDPLTGLYNRRYLETHGKNLIEQAKNSGKQLAIMMVDIDHFKLVNDTYGHPSGDAIIVEVARRIMQNLRLTDLVARYGGEEFVVILPNTTPDFANMIAERLRQSMEEEDFPIPTEPHNIPKTISLGLTMLHHDDTLESAIARSDKNLYQAKESGRNRIVSDS